MNTQTQSTPTAHTPTPWHMSPMHSEYGFHITVPTSAGEMSVVLANVIALPSEYFKHDESEANASFIIRSCNNHARLVSALEGLIEVASCRGVENWPTVIRARAALTAAKE